MNTIIMLDDIAEIVDHFSGQYLSPKLIKLKKNLNLRLKYVSYCISESDRRPRDPLEVSLDVKAWIDNLDNGCEKAAFVVDLSPGVDQTPDVGYGLRVILNIAEKAFNKSIDKVLSQANVIFIVMSAFPEKMHKHITIEWQNANIEMVNGTEEIVFRNQNTSISRLRVIRFPGGLTERDTPAAVKTATTSLGSLGPRIVVCDRGRHQPLIAELIADWL